ncbi:hypothetical protein HanRHA438_Chr06g0260691 [Helianthus annuus]|nr:hypothetical protein HanRHA438_Chr06g0260691 [Helianthus annuus]
MMLEEVGAIWNRVKEKKNQSGRSDHSWIVVSLLKEIIFMYLGPGKEARTYDDCKSN